MAQEKKEKKEEMVVPRRSVHVIFLSCPHCGKEIDHIEACPDCGEPMRVIDVVEKFGDDADRFLQRVLKRKENGGKIEPEEVDDYVSIDKEEPNIILMGADEEIDDGGIDPSNDDDDSLDVIFPDEDDSARKDVVPEVDDDLTKALEQLDSEEDEDLSAEDFGFDDGEIPEL